MGKACTGDEVAWCVQWRALPEWHKGAIMSGIFRQAQSRFVTRSLSNMRFTPFTSVGICVAFVKFKMWQTVIDFFLMEGISMWTGIELLLVLLGAVLFGSTLLVLAMGYSKMELERLGETKAHPDSIATEEAVDESIEPVFAFEEASKNADNVVVYLNAYLRQAQASAERFVSQPSVEVLQKEVHQKVLWH